jgi:hypothetical protein
MKNIILLLICTHLSISAQAQEVKSDSTQIEVIGKQAESIGREFTGYFDVMKTKDGKIYLAIANNQFVHIQTRMAWSLGSDKQSTIVLLKEMIVALETLPAGTVFKIQGKQYSIEKLSGSKRIVLHKDSMHWSSLRLAHIKFILRKLK